MGGWGAGHQKDNFYQESNWTNSRSNSKHRKPPSGAWHPTVPLWEKKFCSSVCLIPWRKICEAKRVMNLYTNIVQWDDSAGEEAFQNAKARFWAEINGLPCNISLPDPDIYIDDVDWDSYTDPELLSDLDREPPVPIDDEDGKLGFLEYALSNRPVVCTGWDDADDPIMEANNAVGTRYVNHDRLADNDLWGQSGVENRVAECNLWGSGWEDHNRKINNSVSAWESGAAENTVPVNNLSDNGWGLWESYDRNADDNSNVRGHCGEKNRVAEGYSWESGWGDFNRIARGHNSWNTESRVKEESGWGDRNKITRGRNGWENGDRENRVSEDNIWDSGWGQRENDVKVAENSEFRKNVGDWRMGDGNYRKREGGGRRVPRYNDNIPKFQGDYCQTNGGWRNGKGRKRASFVHERPAVINKRSLASWQWNSIKSCGPIYHDKSAQSGNNSWSWEKPVS